MQLRQLAMLDLVKGMEQYGWMMWSALDQRLTSDNVSIMDGTLVIADILKMLESAVMVITVVHNANVNV